MRSAPLRQVPLAVLMTSFLAVGCTVQSSQAPAPTPTPVEPTPTEPQPTEPPTTTDTPNRGDELVAEYNAWAAKMCACKDKPCANEVNVGFESWVLANQSAEGSPEQKAAASQTMKRYTKCMKDAMPTPDPTSALPGMGQKCGNGDACAAELECVKYYGIAGPRGGEFTSCEKKCGKGKPACGDGERCATIADGPGQVCRAK